MGIYVLGMHRSGTSALARATGLLVGYEGPRRPAPGNTAGHWEHNRFNYELEGMLRALGGDWASPPANPGDWADARIEPFRDRIANVIKSLGVGPWVVKDPRLCVTLSAILAVPQQPPMLVAIYREPEEVAKSIETRDGYPFEYGLALWELYNRLLILQMQAQSERVLWLSYSRLVNEPEDAVLAISSHLKMMGCAVADGCVNKAVSSIDPGLRHQRARTSVPSGAPHEPLSAPQRDLLQRLQDLAAGKSSTTSSELLPPMTPWASALIDTRRPYTRLEQDNRLLIERLGRLRLAYNAVDKVRLLLNRPVPPNPFRDGSPKC